jgi:hypothetical protein
VNLQIDKPEPGTYRIKRVKGGVWTPVLIWRPCLCTIGQDEHEWTPACDRYPPLRALIDGWEDADPLKVWNYCRPIDRAEYEFLCADHSWARSNDPDSPQANPKQPVNLGKLPPIF